MTLDVLLKVMVLLGSYLIGSISFAYVISKKFYRIDIRDCGSGNAGATNVLRVLGIKPGLTVIAADFLKGLVAVYMGGYIGGDTWPLLCGVAVVVGHNWSVFLKFQGGKGIATSLGVITAVYPVGALVAVIFWIFIIMLTRYVSLGSILSAIVFTLIVVVTGDSPELTYFALILMFLAVYRHRSNIQRLLAGQESKIGQKSLNHKSSNKK